MTIEEALIELDLAAIGKEDATYKPAMEYADWLTKMTTGKGHEDWVRKVRYRETKEEKDDRWNIYKPVTKSACNPVKGLFRRIYRVDGIRYVITHPTREEEIRRVLDRFHGGMPLEKYLNFRQLLMEFTDTNAYMLVLRKSERDVATGLVTGVSVYPLEIPAREIPRKGVYNGETEWIIRKQELEDPEGRSYILLTLYAAGIVVSYRQREPGGAMYDGESLRTVEGIEWAVSAVIGTGSKEFPGMIWGAYPSEENPALRVSPLDAASETLDELVAAKAKYDVAVDKHLFPHRYEYVNDCDYVSDTGLACYGRGYLNQFAPETEAELIGCPKCKARKSENNVTKVILPQVDSGKEVLPLSAMYHYEQKDIATILEMWNVVERLIESIPYTVFGTERTTAPVVSRTATENLLEHESANDRVYPVGEHYSRIVEKVTRVTAQYMNADAGLIVDHAFPENLNLETLTNLLNRLKAARDAGASQEAIFAIQCEIAEKTYAGSPEVVANMKAFEAQRPWRSLPLEQVIGILETRAEDDPDRAIWENFDRLKTEVLVRYPDFWDVPEGKQREIMEEAALEIVANAKFTDATAPEPFELRPLGPDPLTDEPLVDELA